jgi:hypothetical protein
VKLDAKGMHILTKKLEHITKRAAFILKKTVCGADALVVPTTIATQNVQWMKNVTMTLTPLWLITMTNS